MAHECHVHRRDEVMYEGQRYDCTRVRLYEGTTVQLQGYGPVTGGGEAERRVNTCAEIAV